MPLERILTRLVLVVTLPDPSSRRVKVSVNWLALPAEEKSCSIAAFDASDAEVVLPPRPPDAKTVFSTVHPTGNGDVVISKSALVTTPPFTNVDNAAVASRPPLKIVGVLILNRWVGLIDLGRSGTRREAKNPCPAGGSQTRFREPIRHLRFLEFVGELGQIPGNYTREIMGSVADPMIGDARLREVIGADLFGAIAGADE